MQLGVRKVLFTLIAADAKVVNLQFYYLCLSESVRYLCVFSCMTLLFLFLTCWFVNTEIHMR